MEATFAITVNVELALAHVVVGGFFDQAAIDRFVAERNRTYRQLRCPPNAHVTLVDMRDMRIQLQQTVCGFAAVLADPRWRSRRLAFVVGATLARSQIARAASGRGARFFTDVDEACAWLLEDAAPTLAMGASRDV